MKQYIEKDALKAEIEGRIKTLNEKLIKHPISSPTLEQLIEENKKVLSFLDTIEVKEINTWHLQKNESIYDAIKDWKLHVFVCLMDDGTVQKFTGTLCECADGSINTHIDAIDDKYNINNIIFWIETP